MKILNLYAGIGGNRKLWGEYHEITAVELDPKIAQIYQDFFPKDKVIVADAHQYLIDHFKEFDFIWSSPPCPSHSVVRKVCAVGRGQNEPVYPDMKLYEEILLLKGYCQGKWCVENVVSWYKPLVEPQEINKHYFWTNFYVRPVEKQSREHNSGNKKLSLRKGFDISNYNNIDKTKTLRNCVEPETGLHVFNEAFKQNQKELF